MDLDLQHVHGRWKVVSSHGQTLNSNTVAGDPAVLAATVDMLQLLGHWAAGLTGYAQDGFSAPYQIAIAFGGLLYALGCLLMMARRRRPARHGR